MLGRAVPRNRPGDGIPSRADVVANDVVRALEMWRSFLIAHRRLTEFTYCGGPYVRGVVMRAVDLGDRLLIVDIEVELSVGVR